MELLLERENDLVMTWHPGCFYSNGYQYGPIGRIGPKPGPDEPQQDNTVITIPNSLAFSISMKNNDKELYDKLNNMLQQIKVNDNIDVNLDRGTTHKKEKLGVKPEHEINIKKINELNEYILDRYNQLTNELEQMGCDTNDLRGPKLEIIPNEYYEWNEYDDYKVSYRIGCQNGTKFYKFLYEKGLLDKYFPEWYRKGEF